MENALDKGELAVLDITDMELINQLLLVFHKDKYLSGPLTTLMQCITQKTGRKSTLLRMLSLAYALYSGPIPSCGNCGSDSGSPALPFP